MEITQTATATWDPTTTRTDGSPVTGTISYLINIGSFTASTTEPTFTFVPEQIGLVEGDYVFEVRSQEEVGSTGRVSAPAQFPFTVEVTPADPSAPTNLLLVFS